MIETEGTKQKVRSHRLHIEVAAAGLTICLYGRRTEQRSLIPQMKRIADSPENAERLESPLGSESKNCPRLVRQFVNNSAEVRFVQSSVSLCGMIFPLSVALRLRTIELSN